MQTATPTSTATTSPGKEQPSGASNEFKAVQGTAESTSGAVLLIEAYAAIWLVALVFVLLSWLKQKQILERIASLEAAVSAARSEGVTGDGSAADASSEDSE